MKVVYHLGAHKTGSTLIQKVLDENTEALASYGWAYQPKRLWQFRTSPQPAEFYIERRTNQDLVRARKSWLEFVGFHSAENLVISSEGTLAATDPRVAHFAASPTNAGLYCTSPSVAKWFGEVLSGLDVRVVFYVRRQDSFLESLYLECIRQGRRLTMPQLLGAIDINRLSWLPAVDELVEVFGRGNVEFRCFEAIRGAGPVAFVKDFFAILDERLTGHIDTRTEIVNASLREPFLSAAQLAFRQFRRSNQKSRKRFVRRLISIQAENTDITSKPNVLPENIQLFLKERYQDENAHITSKYLGGICREYASEFYWG